MKNEFAQGGMKGTDIDCLNQSPKQFIRAAASNHIMDNIQEFLQGKGNAVERFF